MAGLLLFIMGFADTSNLTRQQATWNGYLNYVTMGIISVIAILNIIISSFGDRAETVIRIRARHNQTV